MSHEPNHERRAARRRLLVASTIAVALVATLLVRAQGDDTPTAAAPGGGDLRKTYDTAAMTRAAIKAGKKTVNFPDGTHLHLDGAKVAKNGSVSISAEAKNAISRGDEHTDETRDPTTARQKQSAEDYVAAQRERPDPPLTTGYVRRGFSTVPTDRYQMAGGCFGAQDVTSRKWLTLTGSTLGADGTSLAKALPVFFKATDLGTYLLHVAGGRNVAKGLLGGLTLKTTPDASGTWTATKTGSGTFSLELPGQGFLSVDETGKVGLAAAPASFALRETTGCTAFPEIGTQVSGKPFAGVTPFQEVRGYVDAHTHGMAFEFLGGQVHCGRPWSPYGVTVALRDCPDHELTGGYGAAAEALLSGKPTHDPVGWPTFKDWPAPKSLTHEGTYYKWMERSWRSGQRLLVNLLVENNKLCEIYPLKRNSCDDMDSVELQAKDMRLLERYVDAQSGGPGYGWYRIVTSPEQAREVINAGKLAVVMGVETSVPFGCTMKLDVPQCSTAQIDQALDRLHELGVRQLELVNKFDNALSGVAGDTGSTGLLVNSANFLETGSFWDMQRCAVQDDEVHDRDQTTLPDSPLTEAQDALFGAIFKVSLPTAPLPLYPSPHHCNSRGLTTLGEHTVRGIAARKMIFDPDHMSVKARKSSLDVIDEIDYPGVVSSHSWSTPDAYPRIYGEGGFITPYAADTTGFVAKWKRHVQWADPRYYFGFGFGADINGLGAQGDPRPGAATNKPVTYPFTTLGGVTVDKQVSGQRTYDINVDGVAHYGLYADWVEDLRKIAGNAIVKDMQRGPEAYLQMWERAEGITPNACANPEQRRRVAVFTALKKGLTTTQVLQAAGQPDVRRGSSFTYCAGTAANPAKVRVTFGSGGKLAAVTRL